MKLLAVETSSAIFSVAASDGGSILASEQMQGLGQTSLLLTDLAESVLRQAGLSLESLDGFAISIGPGSFTGLRIGVMTVKTLAWALKKPVLPVSSLEVIANNLPDSGQPVVPFLDARKGKVYMACFAPDEKGSLRRIDPDAFLKPEEVLRSFKEPAILVGDGLKRYAELVNSAAPAGVEKAEPSLWVPRADVLCRLAARRWPEGLVDDPHRLVPQYLYSQESDIIGK
ncbi:MAG: tRNA (adenosine(37)-N6)-threonylcarbamoyltransferase complex dimerization subunit type 1 TsaB [Candidatus Omnitrophota bacterium]|nr:tRNA (adenosine(37)-N6)-threonylcarbamoyltransferase complex dimerization subunit type 1 TsaB [Candidatus Omnitrophota bacterium]